jgi:hypothetical protein
VEVEASAEPGDRGSLPSGPGPCSIDDLTQPFSAAHDVVEIGETGRTPAMQMWRGTMTVDWDPQPAGFSRPLGLLGGNGWTADGSSGGGVPCIPVAPT